MERTILLIKLNRWIVIVCLFCFLSISNVYAQINITPSVGITWRSTAMNYFNFKGLRKYDLRVPYSYEANVQGFSITPSVGLNYQRLTLSYDVNLRYDYLHSLYDSTTFEGVRDIKNFISDHNLNILWKTKKLSYGIGWGVVNFRKDFEYLNGGKLYFQNLQFNTYNFLCNLPLKNQFHLQMSAYYIPRGFPYNPYQKFIMYSLKLYYKFKLSDNL